MPIAIDPAAHDRLVALTSHVPHVLANVIVNQAGATRVEGHEPLANAGGSLRDMTRIAGANPRIWIDIFLDNADAVREALAEHRRRIEQVEAALAARRRGLPRALDRRGVAEPAADARQSPTTTPARCSTCACTSPTVRACSQGITQAFGAERINIQDFELEHISPRARRHADAARDRRGRGASRGGVAREPGLRRRRLGGAR